MKPLILQLLQILLLLLQVSAQAEDFHEDIGINGCSDSDKDNVYGLDGDVVAYADFDKKEMVYPQPKFVDPIKYPGAYEGAVANQHICQANFKFFKEQLKDEPQKLVPPGTPLLFPKDLLKSSQSNTLVCQASGFYPAPVVFSWTRDGLNISSSSVSQAYPQSDGSFSQLSTLDILPQDGQVYSCSLKHPALRDQRKTRLWTVEFQKPSLAPSVFCAVGLTLGLVGVAVGTFFLVKGNECR